MPHCGQTVAIKPAHPSARKQNGTRVPADGCSVVWSTWYQRRLDDGTIAVVDMTAPEKTPKKKEA
jgi:hypothetical protein